jgi:hypothetical protein
MQLALGWYQVPRVTRAHGISPKNNHQIWGGETTSTVKPKINPTLEVHQEVLLQLLKSLGKSDESLITNYSAKHGSMDIV